MTTDLTNTPASAGVFDGGWVEIARACLPHEALLAAALLQASGIPATTFDTDSHVMMPNRAVAFGGVRVMVPAVSKQRRHSFLMPCRSPGRGDGLSWCCC